MLALFLKDNGQPSRAHRVIPLRLGLMMPLQEKAAGLPLS
jgi:hypothetical protein